jgi:small GTP-binding protein
MNKQIIKAIMLGDAGVGKTTILSVYCENLFTFDYASTIGVDFRVKDLMVENRKYRLQIWDTAGQERFRSITQSYYRGAQIVFLVIDLTRSETIRSVEKWLIDIERIIPDANYKLLVVGNKIDGTIAEGYIEMTASLQKKKIDYFPVSALKRIGIDELFENAVKMVPEQEPVETLSDLRDQSVKLEYSVKEGKCC